MMVSLTAGAIYVQTVDTGWYIRITVIVFRNYTQFGGWYFFITSKCWDIILSSYHDSWGSVEMQKLRTIYNVGGGERLSLYNIEIGELCRVVINSQDNLT